jgi:hypothetical protein
MKTAQHWIDRLDEVNSERDQQNWVKAIQRDAKKSPTKKARRLQKELRAANDMLARIHAICDEAGIPKTDGDVPTLEIQFCEGHRVKLLAERLALTLLLSQAGTRTPEKQNEATTGFGSGRWLAGESTTNKNMGYISEAIGNLEHEQRLGRKIADLTAEVMELRKDKQRLDAAAKLQVNMEIVENCAGNIERYMVALNRHNLDKLICERVAEPANEKS